MSNRTFLFFDIDGVLIDGYHHLIERRQFWHQTIQTDLGIPQDTLARYFTRYWSDVIVGKKTLHNTLKDFLQEEHLPHTAQEVINYWFEKDSKISPKVWKIVTTLSKDPNLHLYLATNQEKNRANYLWHTLNFKNTFRGLFYSGKIGVTKNDPAFFKTINSHLSIDPANNNVIYFDDTPSCLESAAQAGWSGILVVNDYDILNNEYVKSKLEKIEQGVFTHD